MVRFFIAIAAFLNMACVSVETTYTGEITPNLVPSELSPDELAGFRYVFADEFTILADLEIDPDGAFGLARCALGGEEQTLIVFAQSAPFCDGTCGVWGIEPDLDGTWFMMLGGEGHLRLTDSQSMGRPDLIAEVPSFGAVVHKYDGAFYRDTLDGLIYGEAYTPPSAQGWQANDLGFVGIVSDNGKEAQRAIGVVARLEDINPLDLDAGLTDLDGDTAPEIIVSATTAPHCGIAGCQIWIISSDTQPAVLGDAVSQGLPEIASENDAFPLRDLIIWGASGASVLRFEDGRYR